MSNLQKLKELCKAELLDTQLIIWDPEEGSKIYSLGFYGKPLGIKKPKTMKFEVPLILDLIEGLYLLEKGIISAYKDNRKLTSEELREYGRKAIERFDLKYIVYKDLREKGYVATPGIKYGCEFAVYRYGPGIDHAPFLVSIKPKDDKIDALEIIRAGRLATTVRKEFVIAVPDIESGKVSYLLFKWWKD